MDKDKISIQVQEPDSVTQQKALNEEMPATVLILPEEGIKKVSEKVKKTKEKRRKTALITMAVLVVMAGITVVAVYFGNIFFEKISQQNSKPIVNQVSTIKTDSLKITGQSAKDTLEMAYDLSTIAYMPTSDGEWIDILKSHHFDNIQRVENSAKFPFDHEKIQEKNNAKFLFSSVNATIASRTVEVDKQEKTFIIVAFRGTNPVNLIDDFSDMDIAVNEDGVHKGFAWNATNFYDKKDTIHFQIGQEKVSLEQVILEMKKPDSRFVMMAAGHSLGAAVADTFVGYTLDREGVLPGNTLAITFAAPRTVVNDFDYKYDNIINIINADDWIPTIAADKHIGDNVVYTPSNEFRKAHYGIAYVKDADSKAYSTPVGALSTGFKNHDVHSTYKEIVEDLSSHIDDYLG